jgi:phosphohistidine phosphatase
VKILGLFRHAKSDWPKVDQGGPRARDFDRPLNARGRSGAAVMGRHIRDHGINWDRVLASPAVRCAETIEIASQHAQRPIAINWDRRIYLASSVTLADLLREQEGDPKSILMVGHNPGLEDLIFDLVPDDGSSPLRDVVEAKFPTAAYAVLELDIAHWSELTDRCARLIHLTRPRDLDPALGPEFS